VPRPLWWLFPKWGKYGNAAVIHDYLYWDQRYSKKKADLIFREAMGVLGVNKLTSYILYRSVFWFGCCAWESNQERKRKGYDRVIKSLPEKISDWKGLQT